MAGKGFTMKKHWDNPIEHTMPQGARVPASFHASLIRRAYECDTRNNPDGTQLRHSVFAQLGWT